MSRLAVPAGIALVIAVGCVAAGLREWVAILTFALSGFAGVVTLRELTEPGRQRAAKLGEPLWAALLQTWRTGHRRAGGYVVHFGVVMIAVAIAASSVYRSETEMTIREGKTKSFMGYDITYTGTERLDEPHRWSRVARFDIAKDGKDLGQAEPRLNHYKKMNQSIGTPTVMSGLDEDLYLSLVQVDPEGQMASLSVVVEPLVIWLWAGGGVMLLGSIIAGWPAQAAGRSSVNWRVLTAGAVITVPLVALLAAGFGRDPKLRSNALEGREAPPFALKTIDGEPFSLADAKGMPVVVNFWSTWCQPCKIEHPVLMDAAQAYGPSGVQFVAVIYQDDVSKVRAFLNRSGSHWPTLEDPGGRTAIAYGVAGVPETFFIDKDGMIVRKVSGPVSQPVMVSTLEGML